MPRACGQLPDNPLAQLVLADLDAKDGHWVAAQSRFAALPQQGLTQVLRPLLVAWAQAGQGQTDAALDTLAPFVEGQRFRGVYALHSAMIADLGVRTADAGAALPASPPTDYGADQSAAGAHPGQLAGAAGHDAEAQQPIDELAGAEGDLASPGRVSTPRSQRPVVRSATDGMAEAYLALAATLHQQGSDRRRSCCACLGLAPDLTAARLLPSDIAVRGQASRGGAGGAGRGRCNRPAIPVVQLRQAALLEETGRTDDANRLLDTLAREQPDRPEPLPSRATSCAAKTALPRR